MAQGIQPGAGLAQALGFPALAPGRKAKGARLDVARQTAERILRAQLQKMADAVPLPHGMHAFHPAHGIFIQIRDVTADGGLVMRIKACGDAAEHGQARGAHFKGVQPPQGKIAQHAHARMVKGQADVEHDGRDAPLAHAFAGFQQHFARPAENELPGRIVVGNIERGPGFAGLFNNVGPGMHGHHAGFARGLGLQFGHMRGAGVQNIPGHFRFINAGETERDEFAQAVAAHQGRLEPQRNELAPLGVFQQKKIGNLPAGQADFFHIRFVHEGQHVPVGHSRDALHGRSGRRETVVQLTPHARPDRSQTAAHHRQRGRGHRRRQPQSARLKRADGRGVRACAQGQKLLPPQRIDRSQPPLQPVLAYVRIAHAVQNQLIRRGLPPVPCAQRARIPGKRRSTIRTARDRHGRSRLTGHRQAQQQGFAVQPLVSGGSARRGTKQQRQQPFMRRQKSPGLFQQGRTELRNQHMRHVRKGGLSGQHFFQFLGHGVGGGSKAAVGRGAEPEGRWRAARHAQAQQLPAGSQQRQGQGIRPGSAVGQRNTPKGLQHEQSGGRGSGGSVVLHGLCGAAARPRGASGAGFTDRAQNARIYCMPCPASRSMSASCRRSGKSARNAPLFSAHCALALCCRLGYADMKLSVSESAPSRRFHTPAKSGQSQG